MLVWGCLGQNNRRRNNLGIDQYRLTSPGLVTNDSATVAETLTHHVQERAALVVLENDGILATICCTRVRRLVSIV